MDDEWLTVKEAAELSGYHAETIRRLVREGKIQAKKFTFVWMVNRQSLVEYVEQAISSGDDRALPKNSPRDLA